MPPKSFWSKISIERYTIWLHPDSEHSQSSIEALLLKLAVNSFLKHYVVPKYKEKVLQEEAEEGFGFNSFHEVGNKEEGYFDETINEDLTLLSVYKKCL